MNYKIELSTNFRKEAKKLNKKFPSLKLVFIALIINLLTASHHANLLQPKPIPSHPTRCQTT